MSLFRRSGGEPRILVQYPSRGVRLAAIGFNREGDVVATDMKGDVRLWSVADGRELRRVRLEHNASHMTDGGIFTEVVRPSPTGPMATLGLWPFADGQAKPLGTMPELVEDDVASTGLAFIKGRRVYFRSFDDWSALPRLVVEMPAEARQVSLSGDGSGPGGSRCLGKDRSLVDEPDSTACGMGVAWPWPGGRTTESDRDAIAGDWLVDTSLRPRGAQGHGAARVGVRGSRRLRR